MMNKEQFAQNVMDAMNSNEDFCKAFVSAENAEALHKVLNENGFEVTPEEVEALFADGVENIRNFSAAGDELCADQLDEVSGGGALRGTLRLAVSAGVAFGYGAFCGICPAAYAGANYVAGGLAAWTTSGYLKKGW